MADSFTVPPLQNWQKIDFAKESVTLAIDGSVRVERTASNTAGTDLLRLVRYLANEGAARTGGLEARRLDHHGKLDWKYVRKSRFARSTCSFSTAGSVSLRFA